MRLGLLAKKVGMSRFYDSSGVNHPVTILKVDKLDSKAINKCSLSIQEQAEGISLKGQIFVL